MNSEELEQSLRSEFETYLNSIFADLRQETAEFQTRIQAEFDRHIQIAREQLGTDTFESLANVGRAMTMEQAIAYALEDQK